MGCYISSNDNRFYVALEPSYGTVAPVTAENRFPAVRLGAKQWTEIPRRRDKTGTRTFPGAPGRMRRYTSFDLETYLVSRESAGEAPAYGPFFTSAMGGSAALFGGVLVESGDGTQVNTASAHGLTEGMAVTYAGEIRFVTAVPTTQSVVLNAPFTGLAAAGTYFGASANYRLAKSIPSVSVYDFWTPQASIHRLLRGAAVDELEISVNGGYHDIRFRGYAADLMDNASFTSGEGGLSQFPLEPPPDLLNYELVPGHLGQLWMGLGPSRFHTLTKATVRLKNNLQMRTREFGWLTPRCVVPGEREVTVEFELFSQDRASFDELYQAARQRSPVSFMVQMGETEGQLCGLYMKSFVPEVPEFVDDSERLLWRFSASRAQGTVDDELFVAFG